MAKVQQDSSGGGTTGSKTDLKVGDLVQVAPGAVDVTTGGRAVAGRVFTEGTSGYLKVNAITEEYTTTKLGGPPEKVTKVQLVDANGDVKWQVQPKDLGSKVIHDPKAGDIVNGVEVPNVDPDPDAIEKYNNALNATGSDAGTTSGVYRNAAGKGITEAAQGYAIKQESESWASGVSTATKTSDAYQKPVQPLKTQSVSAHPFAAPVQGSWKPVDIKQDPDNPLPVAIKQVGPNTYVKESIVKNAMTMQYKTAWEDAGKKRMMLNDKVDEIQNAYAFPKKVSGPSAGANGAQLPSKYDYRIALDSNFNKAIKLEQRLQTARAAFGIPVHGNNQIARAMKYYMYNRFKTPDINLAHNRTYTHIFFSRPDLNLLMYSTSSPKPNEQAIGHSDSAMIWYTHPDIFKQLTDCRRCGDSNNFNLLLSQQAQSIAIADESLSTIEAGQSWNKFKMVYGDQFNGRANGEVSVSFTETSDYSVYNTIKLWMLYIDNVAKGAWSPSYNLHGSGVSQDPNMSHVYSKTLDYAASIDVIKVGPNGEDIVFWSKFYGVFPISSGSSALAASGDETPQLNINFAYTFKKDMNPLALLEFNNNARISSTSNATYEATYNKKVGHSGRPYVGCPFIELHLRNPSLIRGGVNYNQQETQIKLRFQQPGLVPNLSDKILYRANLSS